MPWPRSSASGKPGATPHTTAGPIAWASREIARYDNSGEPQGTAGPPILDVLKHNDLTNTLVVVTRYYGGTKLGAGGLVRAYGDAAKSHRSFRRTEMRLVREIRAPVPYASLAPFEAYLGHEGIEITSKDFGDSSFCSCGSPWTGNPTSGPFTPASSPENWRTGSSARNIYKGGDMNQRTRRWRRS